MNHVGEKISNLVKPKANEKKFKFKTKLILGKGDIISSLAI